MDIQKKKIYNNARSVNSPCIYFLYDNDRLLYVGKTKCLIRRLYLHMLKQPDRIQIKFSKFSFTYCSADKLSIMERAYIRRLKPLFNVFYLRKINNTKGTNTLKKNRIDILLKEKGLTKLGTAFKIGVSRPGLILWCRNKTQPKKKYIPAICRALNCKEWDLFV